MTKKKSPKKFKNSFSQEARTPSEITFWQEAANAAEKLYYYAQVAQAFHNGEKFDGIVGTPIASELFSWARTFLMAENLALALRQNRIEEEEIVCTAMRFNSVLRAKKKRIARRDDDD